MDSKDQARQIITVIQDEAKAKWGEHWMKHLVRQYCEVESAEVGEEIKPVRRRSQLERLFTESPNPTLETIIRLGKCVGITIAGVREQRIF